MKHRQFVTYLITLVFAGLFSCANPTSTPSTQYTVTLTGTIVNLVGTTLDSVHIVLWNPFSKDTAKSNGTFSISFQAGDKSTVSDSITFSRSGFLSSTKYFSYSSSTNSFNFSAIVLKGVTTAQDSLSAGRPSLRAGEIVYVGSSSPNLSIYGAGGTDQATLTFAVEDSLGNPIDSTNQTLVHFRFATTPPDSLTQLSSTSAKTNSSGTVSVLLGSGLRAGIASVQAYAAVKRATDTTKVDTIMSSIVSIPIFGGFPDSAHFSMSAAKVNIPGAVQAGIQTPITALIGDKYGNPAQPGTIVYFTSTGGIVSPASASSAADGSASVNLISGNPIPSGGIVTVTAELTTGLSGSNQLALLPNAKVSISTDELKPHGKNSFVKTKRLSKTEVAFKNKRTVVTLFSEAIKSSHSLPQSHTVAITDETVVTNSSKPIQKSSQKPDTTNKLVTGGSSSTTAGIFLSTVDVIFSGSPLITIPDTTLNVLVGVQKQINFTVGDKFGNPLSGGSEIKVTTTGSGASDITLTGDVDKILPDTKDKSFTSFTVYAKDTNAAGPSQSENFNLSIIVTSPNGNIGRTLSGTLFPKGVTDTANVAQVVVLNPSIDSLTVTGGGGVSSEVIQFQVMNVNNKPAQNIPVQFSITQSVGGGEYFNPTVATSDVNGKVQTTLFAGIRSGLVQIVAKAKKDTVKVASNPKTIYIRTGIISSIAIINVSSITLSVRGVGGNEVSTIVFEGRDSLGNPIDASNSAPIKFTLQGDSSARVSPLVATTDPVTGRVTTNFTSGIKAGLAYVTASARFDSIKSSPVQFTISGGFPDSNHFSIGPVKLNIAGAAIYGLTDQIGLVVGDKYGNPAQLGSVVFFNTTGGIIQASASTAADGSAAATLTSGNPIPPNGLAVITAQVGASSSSAKMGKGLRLNPLSSRGYGKASVKDSSQQAQSFIRSTIVLFSGRPLISTSSYNFVVPVGSSTQINYIVSDSLKNPLVSGTAIQVTLSGSGSSDVAMSGDVSVNLPDTQDKRYTQFQVSLKDIRTTGLNLSQALTLTIDVNSPNGINKLTLTGNLSGTGGIKIDSTIVSRIVLQNPLPDSILVAGLGGVNTDNIKFKVYNTFGLPDKNVLVTFKMPLALGGGEYLSPASAFTDTGGNVSTTISSGTKFGEVLITASTSQDSLTLSSDPKVIYIVIPPSARLASQVQYLGATAADIFVDGVGALQNSTLSYQVTDSLGIPIDRQRRVGVKYSVQFFPNSTIVGGTPPTVIPSTDSTDDNGKLHTSIVSGTEAGVVQVIAQINVPGRPTIISQPVKITVHAGFADQAHFSILASHFVYGGWSSSPPLTIPFSVSVGDTFSNPVAQGTAVYFHSQAGVVQTGNGAYTDLSGVATVSLLLVNPLPFPPGNAAYQYKPVSGPYAALIGGRDGYFWVYAQTQGHNSTNVLDSVLEVAGKGPITVTGLPASVTITTGTTVSPTISITIKDGNGNPLPDGTTITASIVPPPSPPQGFQEGVTGGISTAFPVTIPDAAFARFPGTGITDFSFNVVNQSIPASLASGTTAGVNITIAAPNIGTVILSFNAIVQ